MDKVKLTEMLREMKTKKETMSPEDWEKRSNELWFECDCENRLIMRKNGSRVRQKPLGRSCVITSGRTKSELRLPEIRNRTNTTSKH